MSLALRGLPYEIWFYIFEIILETPTYRKLFAVEYLPFNEPPSGPEGRMRLLAIRQMKITLVLVCKQWRNLALRFLLEEVDVGDTAHRSLLGGIERSERATNGKGYGKMVRRISLSTLHPQPRPIALPEILRVCPNIDVLIKLDDDISPEPPTDTNFSSIKRFDWWYCRYYTGVDRFHLEGTMTQGLDFLRSIVAGASNLRHLSIGVRYPSFRTSPHPPRPISAHSLTTIRIKHISSFLRQEIDDWDLPNLTHIITDTSLIRDAFSALFGPKIEVVEYLSDEAMSMVPSLRVLTLCPNLRELSFYAEYNRFFEPPTLSPSLRCVRLHARRNSMLSEDEAWSVVEEHLSTFAGPAFPSLEQIVLYGDWSRFITKSRFSLLSASLLKHGCRLEYPCD